MNFYPTYFWNLLRWLAVLYTDSFSLREVLKETELFLNLPLEYSAMFLGWPLESWGREHSPIGQGGDFVTKSPQALTATQLSCFRQQPGLLFSGNYICYSREQRTTQRFCIYLLEEKNQSVKLSLNKKVNY